MTTNPYAPPTAEVADVDTSDEIEAPVYFAVSTTKLLVMSLVTFLIYDVYWFYKHWKMIKEREGRDIIPVMRAIFSPFFVYSLFSNIRDEAGRYDVRPLQGAGFLAIAWVLLNLAGRLPDALALISLIAGVVLLPVQACANRINAKIAPNHDPNSRFTGWNWFWIAIGTLFIVLAIYGSTLPE